jgi:hypothetical protein
MKVRDLVNQLQLSYLPDDELLVAYWDKEFVETAFDSDEGVKITDELWAEAIAKASKAEYWQGCGGEEITDQVKQLLAEGKGE